MSEEKETVSIEEHNAAIEKAKKGGWNSAMGSIANTLDDLGASKPEGLSMQKHLKQLHEDLTKAATAAAAAPSDEVEKLKAAQKQTEELLALKEKQVQDAMKQNESLSFKMQVVPAVQKVLSKVPEEQHALLQDMFFKHLEGHNKKSTDEGLAFLGENNEFLMSSVDPKNFKSAEEVLASSFSAFLLKEEKEELKESEKKELSLQQKQNINKGLQLKDQYEIHSYLAKEGLIAGSAEYLEQYTSLLEKNLIG